MYQKHKLCHRQSSLSKNNNNCIKRELVPQQSIEIHHFLLTSHTPQFQVRFVLQLQMVYFYRQREGSQSANGWKRLLCETKNYHSDTNRDFQVFLFKYKKKFFRETTKKCCQLFFHDLFKAQVKVNQTFFNNRKVKQSF